MSIQQVKVTDIQFSEERLNRLAAELRALQTKVNEMIRLLGGNPVLGNDENARIIGASPHLAAPASELLPGQWELTLVDSGAQVFRVRYNNGGTILTGDLTLT
jgi:hypothetical protein